MDSIEETFEWYVTALRAACINLNGDRYQLLPVTDYEHLITAALEDRDLDLLTQVLDEVAVELMDDIANRVMRSGSRPLQQWYATVPYPPLTQTLTNERLLYALDQGLDYFLGELWNEQTKLTSLGSLDERLVRYFQRLPVPVTSNSKQDWSTYKQTAFLSALNRRVSC